MTLKYVLVTGAAGGMGREVVSSLVSSGYTVFALDIRESEARESVIPVLCDVTDESSIRRAYDFVSSRCEGLYAIIHLAGIYMLDSFVEMDEKDLRRIFDINFFGAVAVNRIFLPRLTKGSRIVIVTSELAPLDPLPFTGVYAVSKAALDKYAFSLCMELQLLGIYVSVLRSGAVSTDMLGASVSALDAFCKKTELYSCNADRFSRIVNTVEAKAVSAEKLARQIVKIAKKKKPGFAYSINRNPGLLLLSLLPRSLQLWIVRLLLK